MKRTGPKFKLGDQASSGCAMVVFGFVLLMFFGIGSFMTIMFGREFARTVRTYFWQAVPCEIISSQSSDTNEQGRKGKGYFFQVEYRYTVAGEEYTSRQFRLSTKAYSDFRAVQALLLRYESGSKTTCYVDPQSPGEAILQRGSLWFGLAVLFPLLFVLIGAGGLVFLIRGVLKQRQGAAEQSSKPEAPISERAGRAQGKFVGQFVFGLFLVVGLVVFYFLGFRPIWRVLDARDWQRVPCRVISSQVRSHRGDDSTTYSVDILYAYRVGDREFKANRYGFLGGSSSGRSGKAAIVRQYPPGKKSFCYVNPQDPTDAVLVRGFTPFMLVGLIPLVFVIIGLAGLVYLRRGRSKTRRRGSGDRLPGRPEVTAPARTGDSGRSWDAPAAASRELRPRVSPLGKLLGGLFIALFWNGIVSVFVWHAVESWSRHRPDWFLTIFLIPFVLIGLAILGYVVYAFLALFNARPHLRITPGAVPLGEELDVRWELRGRTGPVQRLHITLEGREETRYQRGTKTYTDTNVFCKLPVAEVSDRSDIRAGQSRVTIPAPSMHTFEASNNKILWSLKVHGDIARWPDIEEEFLFTVQPQKPGASQPAMSLPV